MNQPDPPQHIDQSQQQGGINFGAFNQIKDVHIGDAVRGDKITIFQLITYTGEAAPRDPAMRAALLRAYRSEVALRYAQWRRRYATLPLVALPVATRSGAAPHYEREELFFSTWRQALRTDEQPTGGEGALRQHTFTDLRDGLACYNHMLLLGPPGGGKTTALWRLALDSAESGLEDANARLPVFVRLGGLQPDQSLRDLLHADLASAVFVDANGLRFPLTGHRALAGLLDELLSEGQLILLWDGLNEVPRSRFASVAQELERFRQNHPGRIEGPRNTSVTTCRADDHALLLEASDGDPYPVQRVRIEGLDGDTIQQMVVGLLGAERGDALLKALTEPAHAVLAELARTPLLLTMLCDVYGATSELPRNRGQLLQRFVSHRWQWEQERRPEGWIAAAVQERALARLAYAITESSGRGTSVLLSWATWYLPVGRAIDLTELLRQAQAADLIELLGDGAQLRFSHQLVQEYFAAVELRTKLQVAMRWGKLPLVGGLAQQRFLHQYARPGVRTGWEETLLLLAGLEDDTGVARGLIRSFTTQPLQAAKLLMADGGVVDAGLRDEICSEALQQIAAHPFDPKQRLDAGQALGLLGDPRYPVSEQEWRTSLAAPSTTLTDQGEHYWRYVPSGTYRIGGWKEGEPAADLTLPAFWIARLPITVAQFARFVTEGYRDESYWTTNGLYWHGERTERKWGNPDYSAANQSVVITTWYEASACCAWLSRQLTDLLPPDYILRLPNDAEWEIAAAYAGSKVRRAYPWGNDAPTSEHAVYDAWQINAPAPVGLCPAGMAACGALDLAGNVWEWASSSYHAYPGGAAVLAKDFTYDDRNVSVRGGAFWSGNTSVRCGVRYRLHSYLRHYDPGFRVILAPRARTSDG
ncbi:SUMF1/EgtB/PvdO family nonheme iron enzyme [Candidatus Viridilinea mediisalina]|uniref:Uncharacterized protein n=1 Tax=Candidatus Viridilinea mediisalina TaxID=2024553 RepID=A0A2A6RQ48_9CHLR|nr:SUMF1/EgtB/PvdO family nonheme iron enzyme [Candidatus Viridilinea mediisalina]PDW05019.1 hypothetical protein CJ255_00050 [Candidatus Viridilinea mediisalina]